MNFKANNFKANLDPPVSEELNLPAEPNLPAPVRRRDRILRLAGSWLGFSGLYAATGGTCPFCGQSTCPAGFLGAGIVGDLLAFGLQAWRRSQK